jgi:hypothetical protein
VSQVGQDDTDKVRENRLRRMAGRQGLRLMKSRRRDPRALDFGGYWLVDAHTNTQVSGPGYDGTWRGLDEVEHALMEE